MDEKREAAAKLTPLEEERIRWASGGPGAPPMAALGAKEETSERIWCMQCGKSVSSPVPKDTIVRAWVECPECIEQRSKTDPALDAGKVAPGGAYSAKGDPSAPTPEPPHVGSSAKRPYSPPVLTEMTRLYFEDDDDLRCPECKASFEFIQWNSDADVDIPAFCPCCGRKNVNLPAAEVKKTLPIGNSPLPEGGLPTAADLDRVAEEKRTAGEP
jgi:hypothetical protein